MLHISTSIYIALLLASPYIVFELFRFVAPALYDNEKRYSVPIVLYLSSKGFRGVCHNLKMRHKNRTPSARGAGRSPVNDCCEGKELTSFCSCIFDRTYQHDRRYPRFWSFRCRRGATCQKSQA
ncbi:MAG: twin-arginine translocase subunit TatC [Bacteroidales bacterium]|nr:twin-arginine translocase subunit TatC [Bacteroidales bacterium]